MDGATFSVALARAVDALPLGEPWAYEPKFDGDRMTIWRRDLTVALRSRTARVVNSAWLDLVSPAMELPAGVVLDGEAVIWHGGRLDFGAVRARASSGPERARLLAARLPAAYAAWDILSHPDHGEDLRAWPYLDRRALLVETLDPLGPPIQAVPMTRDLAVARRWWDVLPAQGIEGLLAKRIDGAYPRGRSGGWLKVRHADTVDAAVVGFTGAAARPRALAVRLPDGRTVLTRPLGAPVRLEISRLLAGTEPGPRARTESGESYTTGGRGITVEVLAGTTRHVTVTVTRVRQ